MLLLIRRFCFLIRRLDSTFEKKKRVSPPLFFLFLLRLSFLYLYTRKTTTEVSRIQDSLDGHRGDEWIKLGIKLRWKFNFTRLVNMLILRAKILFYRPASGFCNCGKRKRLLWANKNARWIGWSSVFSTLPDELFPKLVPNYRDE